MIPEPKDAGSFPVVVAAFEMEAKSENALVLKFRRTFKVPGGQN